MELTVDKLQTKLKSAESSISFIQQEHQKVLSGLHSEIKSLQSKCADLQFEVTSLSSSKNEDSRSLLSKYQEENRRFKQHIETLENSLKDSQDKIQQLVEEKQWQQLQHENQLNSKEAKVQELKKELKLVALKTQCDSAYKNAETNVNFKINHVLERARNPPSRNLGQIFSAPVDSAPSPLNQLKNKPLRPLSQPSRSSGDLGDRERSRIFRHILQESSKSQYEQFGIAIDTLQPPKKLSYLHKNYPTCLASSGKRPHPFSSLPPSFQPSSPNLPPIQRPVMTEDGVDVNSMAIKEKHLMSYNQAASKAQSE